MFSEGEELKLEWLKISDRKDIQCRDCSSPPVMIVKRRGRPPGSKNKPKE